MAWRHHVTAIEVVTAAGDSSAPTGRTSPICSGPCAAAAAPRRRHAIELDLFPLDEVYAGVLWYPVERAAEVLHAVAGWTHDLPDELTSSPVLQLPALPEFPSRSAVVVRRRRGHLAGDPAAGDPLRPPLRELGPVTDTIPGDRLRSPSSAACTWIRSGPLPARATAACSTTSTAT